MDDELKTDIVWTVFLIFVFIAGTYCTYQYNDPDSYYYLSMQQGHGSQPSDNTILGNWISAGLGIRIILIIVWLFCIVIFRDIIKSLCPLIPGWKAILFSIMCMMSPFIFFLNGWYGRADKNIFELVLFLSFLYYFITTENNGIIKYLKYALLIGAAYLSWQGWYVIAVMIIMSEMLWYFYQDFIKNKYLASFIPIMFLGISLFVFVILKYISNSFGLIAEDKMMLLHLISPEIVAYIILSFIGVKYICFKDDIKLQIVNILVLTSCLVFPRLLLFAVPMMFLMLIQRFRMDYSGMKFWYVTAYIIVIMSLMYPAYISYFNTNQNALILTTKNPCLCQNPDAFTATTNYSCVDRREKTCIVVSDWSYGHVYAYAWDENILYKGNPTDVSDMMNYLYYKNLTCSDCVYVYHPHDYARFDAYAKEYDMPMMNQTRYEVMYFETDEIRKIRNDKIQIDGSEI